VVAGAGCFIESYRFGRHCTIAETVVGFLTRSPWRVAIGKALGHSGGGCGIFCVGEVGHLGLKKGPQKGEWEAAIKSEYDSLASPKTRIVVPCPAGRKLVDSKWVFKLKRDTNGQIARYKARLVARGFTQEKRVDYHETFAPMVRVVSIRTLLALAANNYWEVEQLDVVTAFLEPHIEEIYMRQPEGFRHTDINGEERVCLLKKSLYGSKQAPRK
jgi:hypothetical protein